MRSALLLPLLALSCTGGPACEDLFVDLDGDGYGEFAPNACGPDVPLVEEGGRADGMNGAGGAAASCGRCLLLSLGGGGDPDCGWSCSSHPSGGGPACPTPGRKLNPPSRVGVACPQAYASRSHFLRAPECQSVLISLLTILASF